MLYCRCQHSIHLIAIRLFQRCFTLEMRISCIAKTMSTSQVIIKAFIKIHRGKLGWKFQLYLLFLTEPRFFGLLFIFKRKNIFLVSGGAEIRKISIRVTQLFINGKIEFTLAFPRIANSEYYVSC